MTTTTKTPTKRRDWRDWLPPEGSVEAIEAAEPMLTRAELVAALHDAGEDVSAHSIRYWHTKNVLPYPTKRKRGRSVEAVYPAWYVWLIQALRGYQREGVPLDHISPRLRILVEQTFKPATPGSVAAKISTKRKRAIEQEERYRAFIKLLDEIAPRIRKLAPVLSDLGQCKYTTATLTFTTEDGGSRSIPIALTEKGEELTS